MDGSSDATEQLRAALIAIEDQFVWDSPTTLEIATDLEDRAGNLGEEELAVRARLCQANMWMRLGEVGAAARRIWKIHQWGVDHGSDMVQARAHLVWSNVHRHLGDPAAALEHSLLAVELLDDTASEFAQVWHRAKLADALGQAGSMEAARVRYHQAETLATGHRLHRLHMAVLNNWAYTELSVGSAERAQAVSERLQAIAAANNFVLDGADLDTIGNIQIANGQFAQAEKTLQLAIARDDGNAYEDADSHAEYFLTIATAQRGVGATDRAQESLNASRMLCVERELAEVLVRVQQEQAELHAARGEFAAAFEAHKEFFASYNRLHSSKREAQARTRHAMFETSEARQDAERFREQARRDPLTGLRNRRYIDEQLPVLIADADPVLTVAIVDLDHFKRINDRMSHDVGDQVLVMVAKLLDTELTAVAPRGFVARMGGEEFLLVLPGLTPAEAAEHLDRIRITIRGYAWQEVTHGLPVTVSIGIAGTGDLPNPTQPGLLSIADRHLYIAKHGGRNQVIMAGNWDISHRRSYRDGAEGVTPVNPSSLEGDSHRPIPLGLPAQTDFDVSRDQEAVVSLGSGLPTEPETAPPGVNINVPHSARIYDYWLGGKDNFAVDRAVGDAMMQAIPGMRAMAAENRKFVHRVARDLVAKDGIRQFLDVGTGIPTRPNLHEIAQEIAPETRVVYVDNDPIVLVHARALMISTEEGRSEYISADIRQPESILTDPSLTGTLDLTKPVALTVIAILMLLDDADDPWGNVRVLMDALPSGSTLAITHPTADFNPDEVATAVAAATGAGMTLVARTRDEVQRFFGDWEMLEPGLVPVKAWRPDGGIADDPESAYYWAGVARKP
jgi:diguanylate cyclase (GGDEF)-like protein